MEERRGGGETAVRCGEALEDARCLRRVGDAEEEWSGSPAIACYPRLLILFIFVGVAVPAFSFLGDGLRDSADPFARRARAGSVKAVGRAPPVGRPFRTACASQTKEVPRKR
jgi:hypothetical protein